MVLEGRFVPLASAACHLLSGVICYSSFYEFARAAAAGLTCDVSFLRHYNQQVTTLKVHLLRHYTSVPQKKKVNLYWYLKVVEFCCALVNAQIQKTHTHCQLTAQLKAVIKECLQSRPNLYIGIKDCLTYIVMKDCPTNIVINHCANFSLLPN